MDAPEQPDDGFERAEAPEVGDFGDGHAPNDLCSRSAVVERRNHLGGDELGPAVPFGIGPIEKETKFVRIKRHESPGCGVGAGIKIDASLSRKVPEKASDVNKKGTQSFTVLCGV